MTSLRGDRVGTGARIETNITDKIIRGDLTKWTSVTLETSNVAVSELPFGTIGGFQLAASYQSLLMGLRFQVALPAKDCRWAANNSSTAAMTNVNLLIQILIDELAGTRFFRC